MRIFFAAVFIYTVIAMASMQYLFLPMMDAHLIDGLLKGDPQLYHALAKRAAMEMRGAGIDAWTLRPEGQAPAGILALLYYITAPLPIVVIPLNAVLHAIGSLALLRIARMYISMRPAFFICLPFVLSPYYMAWYSQPNKDSYAWAGIMLFAFGWLSILAHRVTKPLQSQMRGALACLAGVGLVAIVRPYAATLLVLGGFFSLVVALAPSLLHTLRHTRRLSSLPARPILLVLAVLVMGLFLGYAKQPVNEVTAHTALAEKYPDKWETWERTPWVPRTVDNMLYAIAVMQRASFQDLKNDPHPVSREALIDIDHRFENALDVFSYIPRALQIGFFAPFPTFWASVEGSSRSVFKNFAGIEMAVFYIALLGLAAAAIARKWERSTLALAILFVVVITAYALATPHLGTLDRYRYPFLTVLSVIGIAQGLTVFLSRYTATRKRH